MSWAWAFRTRVLLLCSILVALPTAAIAIAGAFDGLYGQDAFAYYDYATGPLRQSLLQLKPPPPFFWPPGYPALVALVSLVIGALPLAGQIVSLASGALVPFLTALLARELWTPPGEGKGGRIEAAPLLAGLITALTGQLWQSSAVIMADTTGLACATLGIWALARYGRRGGVLWLTLAASALAWAILTRWAYALVAMPGMAFAVIALARRGRRALLHSLIAGLAAGFILGPTLLPGLVGLWAPGRDVTSFTGDLQVYSWHPLNAFRREFITVDGLLSYRLPNGLYYALTPAHRFFFTPLLAPLIVLGLGAVVLRRRAAPLLLLVGWAAVVYSFHAGAPWQNFRFTLSYLPPLAVLAAIGAVQLYELLGKMRWLLVLYLAVGLVWMAIGAVQLTQSFVDREHRALETVRWVEAQAPSGARLLTFGLTLTFRHYSRIETVELFELSPSELAGLLGQDRVTFVLVDVAGLERQWRGRAPWENYRWLQDGPGLASLGARDGYTLFKVGAGSP